jgi:hypothetical protein
MAKTLSFDEPFSFSGNWWVPFKPDYGEKRGLLTFEPGRLITLELEGFEALTDKTFRLFGGYSQPGYQIIKGRTADGYSVLLLENQHHGYSIFYPKFVMVSRQEILWNQPEEIKARRLVAHYTHLNDWRGISPFDTEEERDEKGLKGSSIKYAPPDAIVAPLSALDAEIRFLPEVHTSLQWYQANLIYRTVVAIVADEAQPIAWLYDHLQHMQDLLSLLIGAAIQKLELVVRLDKSETEANIGQQINIFHSVPKLTPPKFTPSESMLSAAVLGDKIPSIVDAWFQPQVLEFWEVLRDLYFGARFHDTNNRFRFLALTQVLESYHRRKYGGEYLSEKEYKPIKNALIKAIPDTVQPDHQDSLKSRIKYGYQYSLRKRMELLFELLGEHLLRLLGLRTGVKTHDELYLKKIVATRNYLTHYDPEDRKFAFKAQELDEVIIRLALMITALLLKVELAIPESQIETFFKNHRDSFLLR